MQRRRATKVIAGLSALVVGGGALVATGTDDTLASFLDTEMGFGLFNVSSWGLEGKVEGEDWGDHTDGSNPAVMTLSTDDAPVRPGVNAYSRFSLRLAEGSSIPGDVTMRAGTVTSESTASVAQHFRVRAILVSETTACNAAAFTAANARFLLGTATAAVAPATAPPVRPSAAGALNPFRLNHDPNGGFGPAQSICFEFGVANASDANGESIAVQWTFDGESVE